MDCGVIFIRTVKPMLVGLVLFSVVIAAGYLILRYAVTINLSKPHFLQRATIFVRVVSVCLVLCLAGAVIGAILDVADDSGWIPHDKDVPVSVDTRNWIPEEVKMCASAKTSDKKELAALVCYDTDNDSDSGQSHVLKVKFWGSIQADKDKLWRCTRGQDFLTCKLQWAAHPK